MDYYDTIYQQRSLKDGFDILADECRKKDAHINQLRDALRKIKYHSVGYKDGDFATEVACYDCEEMIEIATDALVDEPFSNWRETNGKMGD